MQFSVKLMIARLQWNRLLTSLLWLLTLAGSMITQAQANNDVSIRVGIRDAAPFAFQSDNGQWQGIAIELWQKMADSAGIQYTLEPLSLSELLDALTKGEVDLGVAALTVSQEREANFDFTNPFMRSGLAIATEVTPAGWLQTARRFFSLPFLSAAGALIGVLFAFGLLIWWFEHRHNDEFGGTTAEGIGSGFWWSAVTMTTVGYGDKSPKTLGGRIVGLIWMFAAIIIISGFTAAIASSLTVSSLQTRIQSLDDLHGAKVAVLRDSSAAVFLNNEGIRFRHFETLSSAVTALAKGNVDAVVHDAPMLKYQLKLQANETLQVLPNRIEDQYYAFGLRNEMPLRETLNRALLQVLYSDEWDSLIQGYLE
ncbi:transporter substrate-binding domain-containing protein [Coraliomargarita sp. SDUM461004]|uniref:Transporter substrate-binding domain-containing protein n=1 Tax=Thalassobacterium sedimentorum TaxID=3041258 RepID=A0ABU1AIR8_9BACT|nr:transporter substrate-binding domain-containing protein [Coraliomargarita sp. SDUM461004]MDQ8193765.1 transporter substrate-binding domain-containing protein [Coraliomargarita sp. SDUM461004]